MGLETIAVKKKLGLKDLGALEKRKLLKEIRMLKD